MRGVHRIPDGENKKEKNKDFSSLLSVFLRPAYHPTNVSRRSRWLGSKRAQELTG
jgi:hypothetical protein